MMVLRKAKALFVVFALTIVLAGAFSIVTTDTATAGRCCWVLVCSDVPPYPCWEECRPCPTLPPLP